jgi:hypothetical protein
MSEATNFLRRCAMRGLTDYITECDWVDVFTIWFVLVDDTFTLLYPRLRASGPVPTFADSEVITISLISDTYFHGNEELALAFVRQHYLMLFPKLLSNSRFNRRRRALSACIEGVRRALSAALIDPDDALRLTDSAPIPVCTYQRGYTCQTVSGANYCSVMASRKAKLFGFHLALTTTFDQVVDEWMLAPAAPRDGKMAEPLLADAFDLLVCGDNAYRDPGVADRLKAKHGITLLAPPRLHYDTIQWPAEFRQLFNRVRRRIESALSVLCVVFHVEHPGSRSLSGLVTRVATRILAYTISFFASAILQPEKN